MILIPAIDLKDNKVVRLYKGKFEEVTYYPFTPVQAAQKWVNLGARWLHIVDLDGAKTGEMKNLVVIKAIVKQFNVSVQVGGGVRSEHAVESLLEAGASRVILGTAAVESLGRADKDLFISRLLGQFGGDKIAVSVDCLNGFVTGRGWTETSAMNGLDLAKRLVSLGVKTIIYTDIARDGTLTGPNFDGINGILNGVKADVIASGGISSLQDVQRLTGLSSQGRGLWGAITGKAIYEGKLDFPAALKIA